MTKARARARTPEKGTQRWFWGSLYPPQVGLAWGSGSGLAKEAKEAEAGIVKVPGGTRVKTLNPWGRS